MLAKRLLVAGVLLPTGILFLSLGGWAYNLLVTACLGVAAWEFWRMFTRGGYQPDLRLLVGGVIVIALARSTWGFARQDEILAALVVISLGVYIIRYELGSPSAATDFGVTAGGLLYLGWLGSYLISIRQLPNGFEWAILALLAVSAADVGAFFVGSGLGKHPMTARISPHKTWEGYVGGVLAGVLSGLLLAWLISLRIPAIQPVHGLLVGLVVSVLSPLGDFAESLFKRQFDLKDSSHIFPGHGGMMDRLDTLIYASVFSFYLIQVFYRNY